MEGGWGGTALNRAFALVNVVSRACAEISRRNLFMLSMSLSNVVLHKCCFRCFPYEQKLAGPYAGPYVGKNLARTGCSQQKLANVPYFAPPPYE